MCQGRFREWPLATAPHQVDLASIVVTSDESKYNQGITHLCIEWFAQGHGTISHGDTVRGGRRSPVRMEGEGTGHLVCRQQSRLPMEFAAADAVCAHSHPARSETSQRYEPPSLAPPAGGCFPSDALCCRRTTVALHVIGPKVTSDTNGRFTATDPVNTAVSDLQPEPTKRNFDHRI